MAERVAVALAVITLAVVFGAAAVGKARDLPGTARSAAELGVPGRAARVVAAVLPPVEAATAFLLVIPPVRRAGAVVAAALLATFTVAMLMTMRSGRRPRCHCFGSRADTPIGPSTVARNVALIGLAAVVALA